MATKKKYAKVVVSQNEKKFTRNAWEHPENAQNHVKTTSAKSYYTKKNNTYIKPHSLYAYDFDMGIPVNAVVTSLKFHIRIKGSKKLDVLKPVVQFNSYKKGNFNRDTDYDKHADGKSGDYNGMYWIYPTKKLSSSYDTITYTMPEANLKKFEDIVDTVNRQGFGLQIHFRDAKSTGTVQVEWIQCEIEYVIPNRLVTFEGVSIDETAPTNTSIGVQRDIKITSINNSLAKQADQTFEIVLPLGFQLIKYEVSGTGSSFNQNTMEWTVSGKSKVKNTLILTVIPLSSGFKEIRAFGRGAHWYGGYFYVESDRIVGVDEVDIVPRNLRICEKSCVDVSLCSMYSDNLYTTQMVIPQFEENDFVELVVDEDTTTDGVELVDLTVAREAVVCLWNVPVGKEFYIRYTFCYIPRQQTGRTNHLWTFTASNSDTANYTFPIASAYEKHFIFNQDENGECTNIIRLNGNRIISQVETDVDVLPIYTDEYDKDMYVGESTFGLNQWQKVRYIGCVEVPYAHYDPENKTKDKLLDEHYKNKEYVGKENAVDEDITLKVRIPRRKTPTLIGLVNIDRPIPINLVPSAFENDPLNHRGWAEFYGINVKPTNPLYDDCELDVKYITHNIITRFNIKHEGLVNQFNLPNVYTNTLVSGGDIGEFFDVETDASYVYDGDDEIETRRNIFSFTNGQDILMRSKQTLASKSQFELYWDTALFDEDRENNISRVIRLVDTNDKVVFEYEYYDFDFSSDVYSCNVIGRVLTNEGYDPLINREIFIHSDVEYTEDDTDEDYDMEDIDTYGSSVAFELDSNKLTILEKGMSGYEFEQTVTLLTGSYYLEVYWKNNNNDADTANILTYFDFEINELSFDSQLAEYYNKLIVSPYPVPYKKIVFTRESSEGTIYYLAIEKENEEFSFLLEPFYQYKCGVDLKAEESSIFDFNNSYPIIYIDNGLVRFGINRLNGDLYLDKWDYESKDYIRTNRFRIDKFDDADVSTINDDIIVVKVSDINITMWRGRPYVMLQHEKEDIQILDTFNKAFADGINDSNSDYPLLWSLTNNKNLLPECVGGTNLLKSSCVEVVEDDTILDDVGDFTIIPNKTEVNITEDIVCNLIGEFADGTVSLVVNEEIVGTNVGNTITTGSFGEPAGKRTIYAVYQGDANTNIEISNIVEINVTDLDNIIENHKWKLELVSSKSFIYGQGETKFKLTYGGEPMEGYTVLINTPTIQGHPTTNSKGIATIDNSYFKVPAGTAKWTAECWNNNERLCKKTVQITVKKSTPHFSASRTQMKLGDTAKFRISDELKQPVANASIKINIGGHDKIRTSNSDGYFFVKMSKQGEYTAKLTYAGEKDKYNAINASYTILAGGEDTA